MIIAQILAALVVMLIVGCATNQTEREKYCDELHAIYFQDLNDPRGGGHDIVIETQVITQECGS